MFAAGYSLDAKATPPSHGTREQAMKPRKAIPRVSKARRARSDVPGKTGRVRLYGAALEALRNECWERDKGICQSTGVSLYKNPRYVGDPLAYDMAHIVSRGAGGSDTLENVRD